jgi:prepilin-type N-terminal cleavage/methylation domain-containing protein/prepilin-type processing-associated H-X9-DG protein
VAKRWWASFEFAALIKRWLVMKWSVYMPALLGVRRSAFSVLELMVVLTVIAVVMAFVLPAVTRSREAARRAACLSNVRQIGLALHNYHDVHKAFPPGSFSSNELSWHVHILPQVDQQAAYNQFTFDEGSYLSLEAPNGKNNPHGLCRVPVFLCIGATSDRSLSWPDEVNGELPFTTHYYGVMGPRGPKNDGELYRMSSLGPFAEQGLLGRDSTKRFADITDGASASFVVAELSWEEANCYRTWVRGTNGEPMSGAKNVLYPMNEVFYAEPSRYTNDGNAHGFNDVSFGSEHPGGMHVLMADGSGRFLSELIDQLIYRSAASIDGGEPDGSFE